MAWGTALGQTVAVLGPVIMVAVLLLIPIAVFMTGAGVAGTLGFFLKKDIDKESDGTEYLELG